MDTLHFQFESRRYTIKATNRGFAIYDKDQGLVIDGSLMFEDGSLTLHGYEKKDVRMTEYDKKKYPNDKDIEFITVNYKKPY